MGICVDATPTRERVHILGPHDPKEDRPNCCRHDLSRGALCLCCTCQRHHTIRTQDPECPPLLRIAGGAYEALMAKAYDANVTTYDDLVRSIDMGDSLLR